MNRRRSNITPNPSDYMNLKIKNSLILKAYRPRSKHILISYIADGITSFSNHLRNKKKLSTSSHQKNSSKKGIKLPKIK